MEIVTSGGSQFVYAEMYSRLVHALAATGDDAYGGAAAALEVFRSALYAEAIDQARGNQGYAARSFALAADGLAEPDPVDVGGTS